MKWELTWNPSESSKAHLYVIKISWFNFISLLKIFLFLCNQFVTKFQLIRNSKYVEDFSDCGSSLRGATFDWNSLFMNFYYHFDSESFDLDFSWGLFIMSRSKWVVRLFLSQKFSFWGEKKLFKERISFAESWREREREKENRAALTQTKFIHKTIIFCYWNRKKSFATSNFRLKMKKPFFKTILIRYQS